MTTLENAALLEQAVIQGDLSKLSPADRASYYRAVCESLGLNPLTKPFDYINLQGKLILYAKRDAADQLRRLHGISITIAARERHDDLYVVSARGTTKDGRTDESIGAVGIKSLGGEALANALMKAETKAKRRVTLSLAGLGWLDETETETVPGAVPAVVDTQTGELHLSSAFAGTASNAADGPVKVPMPLPTPAAESQKPVPPPVQRKQDPDSKITDAQAKRLWAIAKEVGWKEDDLRPYLVGRGYQSMKDILVKDYDGIVDYVKSGGVRMPWDEPTAGTGGQ